MKHIQLAIVFLLFFLAGVVGQPPLGASARAILHEVSGPLTSVRRLGQVAAGAVGVAFYATLP